ncbi:MAG: putative zinc-binding metallopeptidase [Hyphomicrobiaceae bacterium]
MKTFVCSNCGNRVYFENISCLNCGQALGFDSRLLTVETLRAADRPGLYRRYEANGPDPVRYCRNATHGACNWITHGSDPNALCVACDLNRTIPNLAEPGNLEAWRELEEAKKRFVYQLLRFGLPLDGTSVGQPRLTFDFAYNALTGHLDGVISINIKEADSVWREQQRQMFGEPYRSLLGHLRHESGHFYWMLLVEAAGHLDSFRALFGDERADYAAAIERNQRTGPAPDWQARHVSAYASVHPWEDWAETWAHYLHMVDALETAEALGFDARASGLMFGSVWPFKSYDIYREETFEALMERWIPLTIALNSLSRSMGHLDFYPFVISGPARAKLAYVHDVIRNSPSGSTD